MHRQRRGKSKAEYVEGKRGLLLTREKKALSATPAASAGSGAKFCQSGGRGGLRIWRAIQQGVVEKHNSLLRVEKSR